MKIRKDHAKDALLVQDACNLSGVVHALSRIVREVREDMPESYSTEEINRHPVVVLFAAKIADLARADAGFTEAYRLCHEEVNRE